jgi:hypothetical protein
LLQLLVLRLHRELLMAIAALTTQLLDLRASILATHALPFAVDWDCCSCSCCCCIGAGF